MLTYDDYTELPVTYTPEMAVYVAGEYKADGTITLIESFGRFILVDTGGPWDKEFLTQGKHGM